MIEVNSEEETRKVAKEEKKQNFDTGMSNPFKNVIIAIVAITLLLIIYYTSVKLKGSAHYKELGIEKYIIKS